MGLAWRIGKPEQVFFPVGKANVTLAKYSADLEAFSVLSLVLQVKQACVGVAIPRIRIVGITAREREKNALAESGFLPPQPCSLLLSWLEFVVRIHVAKEASEHSPGYSLTVTVCPVASF